MMFRRLGVTVLAPGIVLLLFGLRTIEQDRLTLDRQILDRLQNAAQLASGIIDQQLAVWQQFRGDGILLTADGGKLARADRSAYEFADDAPPEEPFPALTEAERREFHGDLEQAAELYRRAIAENPQARQEGLLRLAGTYAKAKKRDLAARTYFDLLRLSNESSRARKIEPIARFELCMLGEGNWQAFYSDLVAGRWRLGKARYLFYSEAARAEGRAS